MTWFKYRQNNSGGSFTYDAHRGISVNVIIQADDYQEANERAEMIGLYFDSDADCSCCGSRWSDQSSYYESTVSDDDLPEKDEIFVIERSSGHSATKWSHEGEYDTFVHPKGSPFYGAYKDVKIIEPEMNGYGMIFSGRKFSDIFEVNELGWDKEGQIFVPAPGAESWMSNPSAETFELGHGDVRVDKMDSMFDEGSIRVLFWSSSKGALQEIADRFQDKVEAARKAHFDLTDSMEEFLIDPEGSDD